MIYQSSCKPFEWKELHGKILKIAVAEPNPEVLEFTGRVYAMDMNGNYYLLHEWTVSPLSEEK